MRYRTVPAVLEGNVAVLRMVEAGQSLTVRVPATSANLGPGFDSLGLAVSLYDTVRVRTVVGGCTRVQVSGEGAEYLPENEKHLVAYTILSTLERAGYGCPGLEIETENLIPHGRGLGSSAAAIVSAVIAANALLPEADRMDTAAVLQLCSTLEGHPDNVAPALLGSLAISWKTGRAYHSTGLPIAAEVIPIAAIPSGVLSTESARALLPASVPHESASANAGRAALLVHALGSAPQFLFDATQDLLHQDYRAQAMLPSAGLLSELRAAGYPAVISGAGPTVMTLARGEREAVEVQELLLALLPEQNPKSEAPWRVRRLDVAREGAKVEVHHR